MHLWGCIHLENALLRLHAHGTMHFWGYVHIEQCAFEVTYTWKNTHLKLQVAFTCNYTLLRLHTPVIVHLCGCMHPEQSYTCKKKKHRATYFETQAENLENIMHIFPWTVFQHIKPYHFCEIGCPKLFSHKKSSFFECLSELTRIAPKHGQISTKALLPEH